MYELDMKIYPLPGKMKTICKNAHFLQWSMIKPSEEPQMFDILKIYIEKILLMNGNKTKGQMCMQEQLLGV